MKKKRILIVDDEVTFAKGLALHLEAHDYEVCVANDGEEALAKARNKPGLILLDINLPKMNGYEVCHRLRNDKLTRYIPIIMLTARDTPQEKIEGLYIGADDYITKPFHSEELFARVEAIFRRTQQCEEILKDRARAISEIKEIIKYGSIIPLFQPIYALPSRDLLGVEVLSHPPAASTFPNAEVLFDSAFYVGMLFELELACHKKALSVLADVARKKLVCFNINPYLVEDDKFSELVSFYRTYTEPGMIGLELTERTAIEDYVSFFSRLKVCKKEGFKISIDDVGSGYASLNSIVELKPDYIKLDIHLIHNIHADTVRQNLLQALVTFCKKSGIRAIAEGVERQEELETLMQFGVDAAQGYLLGRPRPEIPDDWK